MLKEFFMKNRFVTQLFGLLCVISAGSLFAGQEQHVSLVEVRMERKSQLASSDPEHYITRKEFVAVTSKKLDEDKALFIVDMKQLLSDEEKSKMLDDGISINGHARFFNGLQSENSADLDQTYEVWPMREMSWLRDGSSYSGCLKGDISSSQLADKIKSFLYSGRAQKIMLEFQQQSKGNDCIAFKCNKNNDIDLIGYYSNSSDKNMRQNDKDRKQLIFNNLASSLIGNSNQEISNISDIALIHINPDVYNLPVYNAFRHSVRWIMGHVAIMMMSGACLNIHMTGRNFGLKDVGAIISSLVGPKFFYELVLGDDCFVDSKTQTSDTIWRKMEKYTNKIYVFAFVALVLKCYYDSLQRSL